MSAYNTAVSILKNNVGIEIPPEIYNNMAALHFWQGNLDEAKVTAVASLCSFCGNVVEVLMPLPSVRSLVMDKDRMRPGHQLESLL